MDEQLMRFTPRLSIRLGSAIASSPTNTYQLHSHTGTGRKKKWNKHTSRNYFDTAPPAPAPRTPVRPPNHARTPPRRLVRGPRVCGSYTAPGRAAPSTRWRGHMRGGGRRRGFGRGRGGGGVWRSGIGRGGCRSGLGRGKGVTGKGWWWRGREE